MQQNVFNLLAGYILHVQHAPLRVTAFAAKIKLTMSGDFALVKMQAKIDKFANSLRPFRYDRANSFFVTQPPACFERIAHMQLK